MGVSQGESGSGCELTQTNENVAKTAERCFPSSTDPAALAVLAIVFARESGVGEEAKWTQVDARARMRPIEVETRRNYGEVGSGGCGRGPDVRA
jgi:hypothetical protein